MPDRRAQVEALIGHLTALNELLALDSECQWRRHFSSCLREARALALSNPDQSQLNGLSGSVMSVFGGMGSFNDYAPFRQGRPISGMELLEEASGQVYQSALSLRMVES